MQSKATTVAEYLAGLPEDRRKALEAVRRVVRKNLPKGYQEGMQYGMIGYFVPHSIYPDGYHCDPKQPLPFAGMASQKGHMALYMTGTYMSPELEAWFRKAWTADGRKLDMGKACVRFKKLEDVPLEVVGEAIRRMPVEEFIRIYESTRPGGAAAGKTTAKPRKTTKKAARPAAKSTKAGKKAATAAKRKTTKKTAKKAAKKSVGR